MGQAGQCSWLPPSWVQGPFWRLHLCLLVREAGLQRAKQGELPTPCPTANQCHLPALARRLGFSRRYFWGG